METIGDVLKRYRKPKMSIEEFAELVKVPLKNLNKLEADDFSSLPDEFTIKSYLKLYSRHLNLDYKKLEKLYLDQTTKVLDWHHTPKVNMSSSSSRFVITPAIINIAIIILIAISLLGYLGYQLQKTFAPPSLSLISPSSDVVITEIFIQIKGQVEPESEVFINNRQVYADQSGIFMVTIDLQKGVNLIIVTAKKKNSEASVIYRKIIVE